VETNLNKRIPPLYQWVWLLFAFLLPITVLAENLMLIGIVMWVALRRGSVFTLAKRVPFFWPAMAFIGMAALSLFWSVRPEVTWHRLHRLLYPIGIFALGDIFSSACETEKNPAVKLAGFFIAGCVARSLYDMIRVPLAYTSGVSLFDAGNMRDPQMYMAALCLVLAMMGYRRWRVWVPGIVGSILCLSAGLVLHFKRGVWFAFLVSIVLLAIRGKRWRMLVTVAVVAIFGLMLPQVRERLHRLEDVFLTSTGGRMALWREVAPQLLPRYPQGMGWSAVANEDLAAWAEYVQPKLNHLHNNVLEIALETGWAGLFAWTSWMALLLFILFRQSKEPSRSGDRALAAGVLCAVVGLLLNGMVEYNFGDTEILLLYCMLAGLAAAQCGNKVERVS